MCSFCWLFIEKNQNNNVNINNVVTDVLDLYSKLSDSLWDSCKILNCEIRHESDSLNVSLAAITASSFNFLDLFADAQFTRHVQLSDEADSFTQTHDLYPVYKIKLPWTWDRTEMETTFKQTRFMEVTEHRTIVFQLINFLCGGTYF